MEKKSLIVVHNAGFHTDDAFAAAALLVHLGGHADIVRTRDEAIIATGDFVADVGGVYDEARNRFDHHQPGGAGGRPNGIPYAAFGLVWKKFGAAISGSADSAARIDARLVQPIDAWDNGVTLGTYDGAPAFPYFIQDALAALEPTWAEEGRSLDGAFQEAVHLAQKILVREVVRAQDIAEGEKRAAAAYAAARDKRLVVFDAKYDGWNEALAAHPEPLFAVMPERAPGVQWRAYAVRARPHSFALRTSFPAAWAGKRDAELAKISGVPDALFCHNNLFTVSARTKEGALLLAQQAIQAHTL